jgi:hypothetical protein
MQENNTQTATAATIFASHGGQAQAEEMLYRFMKPQLGNNVLQRLADEGAITRRQSTAAAAGGGGAAAAGAFSRCVTRAAVSSYGRVIIVFELQSEERYSNFCCFLNHKD